ncbi:MAG: hypothetical protein ACK475_11220 [Bacteroidota bacterium]|jgi:hypothetical protein
MNRSILIVSFVLSAILSTAVEAQIRFRIATGLSTDWITNDNPAVYQLSGSPDTSNPDRPYGGSFDGAQVGWGLRGYVDLDKQKTFRIPVGVDLFLYRGTQSIKGIGYDFRVDHSTDLVSAFTGFEWSFVEFPLAFARAYVGAEARFLFVGENTITNTGRTFVDGKWISTQDQYTGKPSAFRMGAMARFGIEGEIYYPVFLNTSVGYGVMNLVGRDDRPTWKEGRGELLTARPLNEPTEGLLYHLNFSFMVQVRL